jgi:hypothetical protein
VEPESDFTAWKPTLRHPKARRWDHDDARRARHSDRAIAVQHGAWISIERGIEVSFAQSGQYRTGDYWLIPARAATQAIEWPLSVQGEPVLQPPRGIAHHYAPLTLATWHRDKLQVTSCRSEFAPLACEVR